MFSKKLFAATLLATCFSASAFANNAAFVDTDAGMCGIPDGNGGFALADDSHIVSSFRSGESMFRCQGKVDRPAGGKSIRDNGFDCAVATVDGDGNLVVAITNDSQYRISASGNVTLICHYSSKPKKQNKSKK